MVIRNATLDDIDQLVELENKCFDKEVAASKKIIEKRLKIFPNHFWVVEEDGIIISMANGMTTNLAMIRTDMYIEPEQHDENGSWQIIFGIMTDPKHRNNGYATKLLNAIIAECREKERNGIVLNCMYEMVKFYENLGFVYEGLSMSKHGGKKWSELRLSFVDIDKRGEI